MTEKGMSVRELASYLLGLIENGYGDKIVKLSVNYDNCDHIQELNEVYTYKESNWIVLIGGKE